MAKVNQVLLDGERAEAIVCPLATATPGTCWGMDAKHLVAEQNKDKDLNIILARLKDKAKPSKCTLFLTIMFENKWVEESIGQQKKKPSHPGPRSADRNIFARVRLRSNQDKSTKKDTQQQRPRRLRPNSPEPPRPSIRSESPMAVELWHDGSPKRS